MAKLTKNKEKVAQSYDSDKLYTLAEACSLVKKNALAKFDESIDIVVSLGVDPKKSNQMVRGVVALPHGTGKSLRVLAICTEDKVKQALDAGADYAGIEYIEKIESGWLDIDVIVTTPDCMVKIGKIGKIIGPRNLMPNPKSGTVSVDLPKAISEIKAGKVDFKMDKGANIHVSVGKASFPEASIADNCVSAVQAINRLKPAAAKGLYLKTMSISSTMGKSVKIDLKAIGASI
ncbi:MAG: 50S ribosomal protein L1 [Solitalea-like symbiont of Tyrophagus putrescentiae]